MNLRCNKCRHEWEEDPTAGMGVVQCPECFAVIPMVLASAGSATKNVETKTVVLPGPVPAKAKQESPTPKPATELPGSVSTVRDIARNRERPKPKINIVSEAPPPLFQKPSVSSAQPRLSESQRAQDVSMEPTQVLPSNVVTPFDVTARGSITEATFGSESLDVEPTVQEKPSAQKRDFSKALPKEINLTGETIGGYQVKSMLGAGGMGAVCLARQLSLDRDVALKILPGGLASNPEFLARFTREALSAAQLSHHNIIQVHDVGSDKNVHYISMEFVKGANLGVLVRNDGKLSVDDAASYVLQAARGLKYAHERGIIHRDIKPDNIMLNEHGIVKIADMGLAKMRHEAEATRTPDAHDAMLLNKASGDLTMVGGAMGTPAYMPPEQARDASSVDHRADQYSLGCTLYYLCAGKAPYSGSTAFEIISKHQTDPVPPLEAHVRQVPPSLSKIIQRMLAKNPDDRYPDLSDVIKDLEAYLGVDAQQGAFTPREQHLMVLEQAQKTYYSATKAKLRRVVPMAFLAACVLIFTFSIFTKHPLVAGGVLGLMIMAPLANFILDGILHKTYLFRRVRNVFFGMNWRGWLGSIAFAATFTGALLVLGLLPMWLLFAVFSVGLAAAYQYFVIRPLRQERTQPLTDMSETLKQLRLRGLAEEHLHNFVCRFAGENWEEFFEDLFGYEDMIFARGRWAAADKVKPRKKYATWREPIARWLDGVEEHRRELREKRQLKKVEAKRLEAQGVTEKEAAERAEEAATRILGDIKIASQVVGDKKPVKSRSIAQQTMAGLLFRAVRLFAGVAVVLYFGAYYLRQILPASLVSYAQMLDSLPIPEGVANALHSFPGLLAGAALLLSALSGRLLPPAIVTVGAVLVLGGSYLLPIASSLLPNVTPLTYFYGAVALMAFGLGVSILAKASSGRF